MKKQTKRTKPKPGTCLLVHYDTHVTIDDVCAAAKIISAAELAREAAWKKPLQELARKVGYAIPKEAAEIIYEYVSEAVANNTVQEWEKHLVLHIKQQKLDWQQEDLNDQIKELEAKRDSLK
jgi:ribonuclease HIII